MKISKLTVFFLLVSLVVVGCSSPSSGGDTQEEPSESPQAESTEVEYPTKEITFIVWSSAGSGVDLMARQVAQIAETELGQPIVVENRTGGSGAIAMQHILSQPADGYTIGANTRSQMISLNAELKGQINPEDLEFIAQMQGDPYVLAVKSDSGMETIDDLIAEAQSNEDFSIGGFGSNSAQSIFAADLAEQADFPLNWVPYEGGSEAAPALLGNHVNAILTNVSQVKSHVESGDIRVLGVSTEEQIEALPDTPTFEELGYEGLTVTHWRGFYVKKGTPQEVIDIWDEVFAKVAESPEWSEFLEKSGSTNQFQDSEATAADVAQDLEKLAEKLNN